MDAREPPEDRLPHAQDQAERESVPSPPEASGEGAPAGSFADESFADEPFPEDPFPEEPLEAVVAPAVVAVVVTRDPGPWLEEGLAALGSSDYPDLTVLVIDAGSKEDPTPRIASVLPKAFVRRLPENVGFAAAANEALSVVEGAPFLVMAHDDVVLEPTTIRLLVEEAYRSNAAIVGPKLVDYDDPAVLLEVGLAIDRFGVPHSAVEPGELDQEQHDAVRDVFYVSSAVMLLRADLFAELGGFDPETFPGAEDLDLCWRARIAGARVLVAPDARVRHRRADALRDDVDRRDQRLVQRNRVRAVLKSYSTRNLLFVVPVALVLATAESVVLWLSGRRDQARALVGAWFGNLRAMGALREARQSAQALRRVPDSDLRSLQVRGSSRVRAYVTGHLRAEDRIRSLSERSRTMAGSASERVRGPAALSAALFVLVTIVGSRALIVSGVPQVGSLLAWPGVGDLLTAYTSAWREWGLGAPAQQPALLGVLAAAGTGFLGMTGFARTVFVVVALPLGALGAWRLGRSIAGQGIAALLAALAYGVNPVGRNAIAGGDFGPLVLFVLAPWIVHATLRAAGAFGPAPRRGRAVVSIAIPLTLAVAAWPPALLLPVLLGVAVLVSVPLVGGRDLAARVFTRGGLGLGGALLLLLPWPLVFLWGSGRWAAFGAVFTPQLDLARVLRFETGPAGAGSASWVLLGTGLLVLVLASGPRFTWAVRAWALTTLSYAACWLPERFASQGVLAPEGVLVPAALGVALAVGLGAAVFLEDVRQFHFGWRQVAATGGAIALAIPALAFAADALDGRWGLPDDDWSSALSWMPAEQQAGDFRVLWLGQASVLPVGALRSGAVAYGTTYGGPGDVRGLLPPPQRGSERALGAAVALLQERRTNHVGVLLGPMGVRYVAVPERPGPGLERSAPAPSGLRPALDDQLDLVRVESAPGLLLYENRAFVPIRAWLPAAAPKGAVQLDAPQSVRPLPDAQPLGSDPVRPGTVYLGQSYDRDWQATAGGSTLRHTRAMGWAQAYRVDERATVGISYTAQWLRYPALLIQLGILVGAWCLWRGRIGITLPRLRPRPNAATEPAAPDPAAPDPPAVEEPA